MSDLVERRSFFVAVFVLLCSCVLVDAVTVGPQEAGSDEAAAVEPKIEDAATEESAREKAAPVGPQRAAMIAFEGPITPFLEKFLRRKLMQAKELGVDVVIVDIDSPGGYVDASLACANLLLEVDWATTVAYIPREGLSGAAITALGCDHIVMHPGGRFGDAGPIFQAEDAAFRHAPEKLRTDLALQVSQIAEAKGRPKAFAVAMVDMDAVVYRVRNNQTGEETYLTETDLEKARDGVWERVEKVVETREGYFFESDGKRAAELGLAAAVVESKEELLRHYNVDQPPIEWRPKTVDTVVYVLNSRVVTALLFIIGIVALFIEFSSPGIGVGGLTSGLCFSLFFWSRVLGGTAGWLEGILLICGIVFLMVEAFIIPGFGVAGLAGIMLVLSSVVLASQHFVIPSAADEWQAAGADSLIFLGSIVGAVVIMGVIGRNLGSIPLLNRVMLKPPTFDNPNGPDDFASKTLAATASSTFQVNVGDWGIADSPLRPAGKVRFGEEFVDVVTEGGFIEAGEQVKVIKLASNQVVVRVVE